MSTVFRSLGNAEIVFQVFSGTFTEDPSTLNMLQDTHKETVLCMLQRPKRPAQENVEPGIDARSYILEGNAIQPKFFPKGLTVGNVGTITLFDRASGNSQKGLFEILDLQQSVYIIVSRVKGHAITGRFTLLGVGGIGNV